MSTRPLMLLLIGVGFVAAFYVALCALLYFKQDDFIFFRVANDPQLVKRWQSRRVEIRGDDVIIEGWWAENSNSQSNAAIIYFGGNAEDVLYTAESAGKFDARRILVANYRGYGSTPGVPSERALFQDALAIYDYAIKQPGVSADNLFLMGRSLGSGVATYVAANRSVRGVVLVTPYDSIAAVAQAHYPYFPVRLLLKHQFPSDTLSQKAVASMIILAGENDAVIPPIHAQRLYAAWPGPKRIQVLTSVGHNDIEQHAQYYALINTFLEQMIAR